MTTKTITPPLPDLELCLVEGGEFMMGDDSVESARPAHRVRVSSFWMGKFPVTQRLWQAVMRSNPSCHKGERLPVEMVSWDDAQKFLQKLNALPEVQTFIRQLDPPGRAFRLPTEAEWEYAARGGIHSQGYKYAGSDRAKQVVWNQENSEDKTHEVGLLMPNELGLHDMSGNVWEWCNDWCSVEYLIDSGDGRVLRGGSWFNAPQGCRVIDSLCSMVKHLHKTWGFRLVLSFRA